MAERDRATQRSCSAEERQRIVEDVLTPSACVVAVAREHGLNANILFSNGYAARLPPPKLSITHKSLPPFVLR